MTILETNSKVIGSALERYTELDVAGVFFEGIEIEFYASFKIVYRLSQHVPRQYFLLFWTKVFKDEFLKILG